MKLNVISDRTRRALVVRIGALGDVLLTRRLTCSLSRAGFRSTVFAPSRHASLLLADPWIDAVLDSESPRFASAFSGSWPEQLGFDVAILISNSSGLEEAVRGAAKDVIRLSPGPTVYDAPIWSQWTEGVGTVAPPSSDAMPILHSNIDEAVVSGATLIHPGSGSAEKNWNIECFVGLAKRLETLGHRVVWILGPAEADLVSSLPGEVIDRTSLSSLAATLARSTLYIGNDSGVSHLAAAVGAPALVLFGPTSPVAWRPDGPRVRTIQAPGGALADLDVGAVMAAVENLADSDPGKK